MSLRQKSYVQAADLFRLSSTNSSNSHATGILKPPEKALGLQKATYKMSVTLHTSKGPIKLELNCEDVPRSAANFLALSASQTFDNTPFHRVIPNFIIQTGDPSGTGKISRAAFAKRLPDEIVPNAKFDKPGIVAFANAGRASTKGVGSQFFITLAEAPHLDNTCTIVGKVIHGMDVARDIASVECVESRPETDIFVEKVTIHANPFADGSLAFDIS